MTTPDFHFYRKADYFRDLIGRIGQAAHGDRIALATMSFDVEYPLIQQVATSLGAAAKRGANVSLAIDAYNFLKGRQQFVGPLLLHHELPASLHGEFADKHQLVTKLRAKGVAVAITNQPHRPFTNPYAGRSHIKFGIINDRIYLGGCNLDNPGHSDLMVGWDDTIFAGQLYEFAQQMISTEGTTFMNGQDRTISLSPSIKIFIDAGKPRQSLILQQALQLIDQAGDNLLMTNQFFPNGVTMKHLLAARQRGAHLTILFNHPGNFSKNERLPQYLNLAWSRLRLPSELFARQLPRSRPYLHAKVIATESAALIGSHNYISTGVSFGTAEIAVLVHNPVFARQISNFVEQA